MTTDTMGHVMERYYTPVYKQYSHNIIRWPKHGIDQGILDLVNITSTEAWMLREYMTHTNAQVTYKVNSQLASRFTLRAYMHGQLYYLDVIGNINEWLFNLYRVEKSSH
jgi:hypothetical protein